ncbi:gamma-aminobutyric acid type B receptor subunit 1-like [Glandiceps talaboti]
MVTSKLHIFIIIQTVFQILTSAQSTLDTPSESISLFTTDGVDLTTTTAHLTDLLPDGNTTMSTMLVTSSQQTTEPSSMNDEDDKSENVTLNIVGFFPGKTSVINMEGVLPACQMALDHINERDDILPGYFLNLDYGNTQCNPGYGTKVLFEFINSNTSYIMVLGAGCSGVAQPVSMASNLWNLVQMSYGASNPALSNRNRYPSFYRTYAPDSLYNYARLDIIKYFNWTKVATLHENQELFSSTINDLSSKLRDNGIEILTSESFTVDPSEQVKNLKEKNARIIFGNFYEDMARQVFCEVYKQKMYGKHYAWFILGWYTHDWWKQDDPNIACTKEELFEAIDGYIATENIDLSIYRNHTTTSGFTPNEYQALYEDRMAQLGQSDNIDSKAAYCYDAVWSVALTLNESMETLKTAPNLTSRRLEDFAYSDEKMKQVFIDTLNTLHFDGVSGPVSFTEKGDREGLINIEQLQNGKEVVVGIYFPQTDDSEKLRWDKGKDIIWKGGKPPKDATVVIEEFQRIPVLYVMIFAGLAGGGVLLALGFLVFTLVYWKRTCISKAAPGYLVILIIGIILVYITVGVLGLDAGIIGQEHLTKLCTIRAWTLPIGFTLSYGTIFSKVYRAHKLFTTKANLWKPGSHTLPIFGRLTVFLMVDVVILTVWIIKFPMELAVENQKTIVDEDNNIEIIPRIEYCDKGKSIYFIAALMVFHGLQLLLGAFLSYETREVKIPSLNDVFFNGIATYTIVTLSIICAPLSFIINNKPDIAFLIEASLVWSACTLTLFIIFIPKIFYLRGSFHERRNTRSKSDEQIYEEEVDEETKLRHKLDEVEEEIELVKKEIHRRKKFGRYATMRGCGIWFFGHHFGCTCGGQSGKYDIDQADEDELGAYTNQSFEVAEMNVSGPLQFVPSSSAKTPERAVEAAEMKNIVVEEISQVTPSDRESTAMTSIAENTDDPSDTLQV